MEEGGRLENNVLSEAMPGGVMQTRKVYLRFKKSKIYNTPHLLVVLRNSIF